MSLPRKGGQDLLVEFDRKWSLDSDSSEYNSELGSVCSDIENFVHISDQDIAELTTDGATGDEHSIDKLDIDIDGDVCSRL